MTTDTVGGVWTYAVELIGGLRSQGVSVALVTAGAPPSAAQRRQIDASPNVVLFEGDEKLEWMADPWDDVRRTTDRLGRIAREWQPDVVHLNGYAYGRHPFEAPVLTVGHSCVLSWFAAVKGSDAPPDWDRYRDEVAAGLRGADLVVAPTRAMLAELRRHYGPLAATRVIHNARAAAALRPAGKAAVVFAAGRLWDEAKNLAALVAVAPSLPWPVRVAGDATCPDGRTAGTRGLTALGVLDETAVAAEMARAAIYALPAKYEPFGLSVLEAALSGCALVLGDIASLREVWGDAAVYVAPDDTNALADALTRFIESPPLRERFAAAARARAAGYASPAAMADAYLEAYRGLAGRHDVAAVGSKESLCGS